MKLLCRLGWHTWHVGLSGSWRWCRYCTAGQVWNGKEWLRANTRRAPWSIP